MASTGDDDSEVGSLHRQSPPRNVSLFGGVATSLNTSEPSKTKAEDVEDDQESPGFLIHDEVAGDSDAEDDTRENRFPGADWNWLSYTASERALMTSLVQQRSSDLGIHLYNAHALKARIREDASISGLRRYGNRTGRMKVNGESTPWQPDARWTAWPVPPEEFPQKGEQFYAEHPGLDNYADETYRKVATRKSSADLEDEIQALMLRKTKELILGECPERIEDLDILADDEEADAMLRSHTVDIAAKFDALLLQLHKTKAKYARGNSRSQSRPNSTARASAEDKVPTHQTRRRSRKKMIAEDEDYVQLYDEEVTTADTQDDSSSSNKRQRLNPRDWTDVLKAASLAGFDSAAIDRAAQRCTSLFGETTENLQSFRHCPVEDCSRHGRPFERLWRWREHMKRKHKFENHMLGRLEAGVPLSEVVPRNDSGDTDNVTDEDINEHSVSKEDTDDVTD